MQLGLWNLFMKLPLFHNWAEERAEVHSRLGDALGAVVLEQVALQLAACPAPCHLTSA